MMAHYTHTHAEATALLTAQPQVFPDEFHLETLEEFLTTCVSLQNGVDIRLVLGALTDRLSRFASHAEENRALVRRAHAFEMFRTYLPPVIETFAPFIATVEFLRTYSSLMKLVLSVSLAKAQNKTPERETRATGG